MLVPAPFTSTATRDGSRIIVARHDDVTGGDPLITVMADNLGLLGFSCKPAETLGRLLLRAVADTVTVTVSVTNSYPTLGRHFARTEEATLPAPPDGINLAEWAQDELIQLTGEGAEYASTHGVYEARIVSAPVPFEHLVGLVAHGEG